MFYFIYAYGANKNERSREVSHYTVAVFHRADQRVEDLLEKYDENRDVPEDELVFVDQTDWLKEQYKEARIDCFKLPDGKLLKPYSNELFVTTSKANYDIACQTRPSYERKRKMAYGEPVYLIYSPEACGAEKIEAPPNKIFTFNQFCKYWDYVKRGKLWGYLHNPYAKWDWYEIGGRWDGILTLKDGCKGLDGTPGVFGRHTPKDGKHVSEAYVSDVDFSPDKEAYDRAIRWWEVVVENSPLKEGEEKRDFFNLYKIEHLLERYENKEKYAKERSTFATYACITPDGKWHAPGNMGWFGMSDASDGDEKTWHENYYKNFIENAEEDIIISIVDCHI